MCRFFAIFPTTKVIVEFLDLVSRLGCIVHNINTKWMVDSVSAEKPTLVLAVPVEVDYGLLHAAVLAV